MKAIKILCVALCLVALSGCATLEPFFVVGAGVQINRLTDELLRTTHKDQCDVNVKAIFGPGIEWPGGHTLTLLHQSWYFCGGPINDKPEMYQLDLRYTKKIGGY